MKRILLLGPQGSGKGTQAQLLSAHLGIPALSMGQLCRDEVASGSELGKEIETIINDGRLVPDVVALQLLKRRLEQEDARGGYILDGYPRNDAQLKAYGELKAPTDVIVISVPREESMKRLQKRAELEGRADDTPELIARRLDIYESETLPVIDRYAQEGIVRMIDGVGSVDAIAAAIKASLN